MSSIDFGNAVVNSSPLICLAKAGLLKLLFQSFKQVAVPQEVLDEIMRGADDDRARLFLSSSKKYTVVKSPKFSELLLDWDLGKGETSVLQYASEHEGTMAVLDDAAARKCANVVGLPYCGTLGVLAKCKRMGIVDDLNPCLEALKEGGLWLSGKLSEKIASL